MPLPIFIIIDNIIKANVLTASSTGVAYHQKHDGMRASPALP